MSGQTQERYLIDEQIGSGGMATVYRATDTVLQRSVALKLLNDQIDPALKARFEAEARAVAQLNHPNVVNVYDVGEFEGSPYIVMEYVRGTNLKRLIQERGPLPVQEAEGIVRQVAAALSYAHRNGLVHCDVKPHNILVSPDGRAKLVDFGIAQAQVDRKRRKSEQVYGTPLYIAPEQAAGQPVSPRTDVYGLGLVLWEALTGTPPKKPDPSRPVYLPFSETALPQGLAAVIQRATATDPADRYASVDEFVDALTEWRRRGGAAAAAQQATVAYRPIPANGRQPVTAVPSQATRTMPSRPAPVRQERQRRRLPLLPLLALALLLLGLGGAAVAGGVLDGNTLGGVNNAVGGVLGRGTETPERVVVPRVVGLKTSAADREVKDRGLTPDYSLTPDSDEPAGTVVAQDPQAGTEVDRGSTVEVTVSGTPETVDLPAPTVSRLDRTPTPRPAAGERIVQMLALDRPVRVTIVEDDTTRTRMLQPGQYYEARGRFVRVGGAPASELEVTVDRGKYRGSLLEVANALPGPTVRGAYAFIEFGRRSASGQDGAADQRAQTSADEEGQQPAEQDAASAAQPTSVPERAVVRSAPATSPPLEGDDAEAEREDKDNSGSKSENKGKGRNDREKDEKDKDKDSEDE